MCFILFAVLALAFLKVAILENVHYNEFAVVSTSQRPSDVQLADRVSKLEEQLQLHTKLNENIGHLQAITCLSSKVETMDKKMTEIQEKLETLTNAETQSRSRQKLPKHCKEVQERGYNVTGIYTIQPDFASEAFLVRCNMDLRGGGWTYFHNRYDGTQDFYLNWRDYKEGFGNLGGEFWLGLEHLHQLTAYETTELLIELVDWDLKKVYAHYNIFSIGSENEGYLLKALEGYSGDTGDSLNYQAGSKFSTKDKDQDNYDGSCATTYVGAWWFKACFAGHLNGQYLTTATLTEANRNRGLNWMRYRGEYYSLKEARMMVKPHHI